MAKTTLPLLTKRCALRLAIRADYEALLAGVTAPAFPSELPLANLYRQQKLEAWLNSNVALSMERKACLLSIDLHTGEHCIGQVSLSQKDESTSWNLAFWLHPTQWGKGLASEAAIAGLTYGFTVLGISEIWAGAAAWNARSMRMLRQIGLRPIPPSGTSERASAATAPFLAFSISREAWLSASAKAD